MVKPSHSVRLLSLLYLSLSLMWMSSLSQRNDELFEAFYSFAAHYKKPYLTNSTELEIRFQIFKDNVVRAKELNKAYDDSQPPVYGVNKFADLSPHEFRALYLSDLIPSKNKMLTTGTTLRFRPENSYKHLSLPDAIDWRKRNVLTPIKDQGTCGACWSFSVVETMESMYAIQYNTTAPWLSVQQLIDCDEGNNGCEGGDICQAAEWASQNGVVTASTYPTTDRTDRCKRPPASASRVYIKSHQCQSLRGHEDEILQLVAEHGPVAAAVDASTWHNYVGGIIQYHCSTSINHAVQIVGYDLTGDVPYYIVRNSWGTDFGDNGFLYIKYGGDLCGLSLEVASLDVK